ncbi:MAG: hypothetical protein VYA67_21800 [Actinomycetota bacterium]|nr:hypothetical protein [Actinomycetota bacterium]
MRAVIQITAAICIVMCLYAICRAVIDQTNPYPAAIVLAGVVALFVDTDQEEYRRRLLLASARQAVWNRRDREAGA